MASVNELLEDLKADIALLRDQNRLLYLNVDFLTSRREGIDPLDLLDIATKLLDVVEHSLEKLQEDSLKELQKYFPAQSNQETRGL